MRILITCWLPLEPADSGYKQRVLGLYGALGERAEVLVVSPGDRPDTGIPWSPLELERKNRFLAKFPKGHVLQTFTHQFRRGATKAAREFRPDLVIAEGLWAAPMARNAAKAVGAKWGVTVQNIEALSARGVYPFPVPKLLGCYERRVYRNANLLLAITSEEAVYLKQHLGSSAPDIIVVPNGVRTPPDVTMEKVKSQKRAWGIQESEKVILFVGRLNYPPNKKGLEWCTHEVFPLIDTGDLPVRWIAVGKPIPEQPLTPFEFVGYVEDLPAALAAADVCIAPIRHGSGTSIKVLDYIAAGRPVVATSHGARGLPIENGRHLLVADTPQEFARAIERLLNEPDEGRQLADLGRELVRENLTWPAIAKNLEEDLRCVLAQPTRTD